MMSNNHAEETSYTASPLECIIAQEIKHNGPIGMDRYIELCLTHPEHGYYIHKDPLGKKGDFTTAPEISQLFGEAIGFWATHIFAGLGAPPSVNLIELGPGRGSLMNDILRIAKQTPKFYHAIKVHLVEKSHALKSAQEKLIKEHHPEIPLAWHEDADSLGKDVPSIIIGNEFLDALPFKQFEYCEQDTQWMERAVAYDPIAQKDCSFFYEAKAAQSPQVLTTLPAPKDRDIFEHSPMREETCDTLFRIIQNTGGACLLIDYGYLRSAYGDTFQALKQHKFDDPLANPGQADLTNHVDFQALHKVSEKYQSAKAQTFLTTQRQFLRSLHIEAWTAKLSNENPASASKLKAELKRLIGTDKKDMGELFKVLIFQRF